MKKLVFIILLFFTIAHLSDAQRWRLKRYRLIAGLGTFNYFGDIGGAKTENNLYGLKDIEIGSSRPGLHLGMLYKLGEVIDTKANFSWGYIYGTDANSKNAIRNISFTSSIFETSLQVNYIFFTQREGKGSGRIFSKRGMINNYSRLNLFIFAGAGAAFFNPKVTGPEARLNTKNALNEFQKSTFSFVPMSGIGAFMVLNSNWELGAELGSRLAMTDYLDGFSSYYSTAKLNDIYFLANLSVMYRLKTSRNGWPLFDMFKKY